MKFYRFKTPFDYLKRTLRTIFGSIIFILILFNLVYDLVGLTGIISIYTIYILIFRLGPLLIKPLSLEIDHDIITVNYLFTTETIFTNKIEVLNMPVHFNYLGAKRKLILNVVGENKKIVIYDYWADYKLILDKFFEIKLLDTIIDKKRQDLEKSIKKISVIFVILLSILIIIIASLYDPFIHGSQNSLIIYIIGTLIISTVLVLIARNYPKFKEYRSTFKNYNRNKSV